MRIPFLEDEFWYGGAVRWGNNMPIGPEDVAELSLVPNLTPNQAMPLFLSSKGRYLWLDGDGPVRFDHGSLEYTGEEPPIQRGETLRSAYLAAMEAHFPFTGRSPGAKLFGPPIFNTWIELTFHQTQEAILRYASDILSHGFEPGVLMVDDGWSECYGDWRFHSGRFPDPKGMLEALHDMGFQVMLWLCPYVTPDSMAYREALEKGYLLPERDGRAYLARWWNGCSAVVDLAQEGARSWLYDQLEALRTLGVDGFKFDGGDSLYLEEASLASTAPSPNEYCRAWGEFGERYALNEYRSTWCAGGRPLFQRLCDKRHSWDGDGLAALVPDTLAQGITGHPFCCADMVGGGEYLDFREGAGRLDEDLFVRHSGVSCLMPSIQFSAAPWRVLSEENQRLIHGQLALRRRWAPLLQEELRRAALTGEPMIRYMAYNYPGCGYEHVIDQFMVGERLLVAPLLDRVGEGRHVHIPKGRWRWGDKELISSGEVLKLGTVDACPVVLEWCEG